MARPLKGVIDLHDRDRRARQTYNDHAVAISRYAEILAGWSDGPDLVQEAFQILFNHRDWLNGHLEREPHGNKRVAAFLRTTVKNRYKMLARGSDRRRKRNLRAFLRDRGDDLHVDYIPSVDDATVHALLQHLEDRQAEAVGLYILGLTPKEIAVEMNIQPGSVRKSIKRGLDKLAMLVEQSEDGWQS